MRIKSVSIGIINWEKEYEADMDKGIGFDITRADYIKSTPKEENIRAADGIYSIEYGTTWQDDNAFAERYRCKCGETKGKPSEGEICPLCSNPVTFVDSNIEITGWFKLNEHRIIQPAMYAFVSSLVGEKNLEDIISNAKRRMNKNGKYDNVPDSKNPYRGIGMIEFEEKFDEIMDFFLSKKAMKRDVYDEIYKNRDCVFSSVIPVYSLLLRPIKINNMEFSFVKINNTFSTMATEIADLNDLDIGIHRSKRRVLTLLNEIQQNVNFLYEYVIDLLSSKKGVIRNNILGGRYNFSSRCVIIPIAEGGMKVNEVILPYKAFMELYRMELINLMCTISGLTISQAEDKWNEGLLEFDPTIHELMEYMISNTSGGLRILINRNPSISYGSVLVMRVAKVEPSDEIYTMAIPINILGLLAGDFDGDVLNILSFKEKSMADAFDAVFNPRTNMFIDRNTGYFNHTMGLVKDQIISLNVFNKV